MPFYFRVNQIRIADNKEAGFLFFRRDLAEIKLESFITTSDSPLPDMASFTSMLSAKGESKREAIASMVTDFIRNRKIAQIDCVRDNQTITFGDTGYVLYRSAQIPEDLNWCMVAVEDDGDVRNIGESVDAVLSNPAFNSFCDSLQVIIGTSGNPAFAAGVAMSRFIGQSIANALKNDKDDLAGLLYMSLNRREHYPSCERKAEGVKDLTGNMTVDYSLFGFDDAIPRKVITRLP